jgi:hypothetical protein
MEINLGCDGCNAVGPVNLFNALGYQMRYCAACTEDYKALLKATEAVGAKYQRLLDEEEMEVRARCPLRITPLDLPKLITNTNGEALTLG